MQTLWSFAQAAVTVQVYLPYSLHSLAPHAGTSARWSCPPPVSVTGIGAVYMFIETK